MVDTGDVNVLHQPSEKMSDMLKKPKQGLGFRRDRSCLMNVSKDYDDNMELKHTSQELFPEQVLVT